MPTADGFPDENDAKALTGLFNKVGAEVNPLIGRMLVTALVHPDVPVSTHNELFLQLQGALSSAITATNAQGGGYRQRRRSRKARQSRRN